jgi:hypothetical protein
MDKAQGVVSTSQGGAVTQAVNDAVTDGALYFTAAGNYGNFDSNKAGTNEGDFTPVAAASPLPADVCSVDTKWTPIGRPIPFPRTAFPRAPGTFRVLDNLRGSPLSR